jgi:hypothetical protein
MEAEVTYFKAVDISMQALRKTITMISSYFVPTHLLVAIKQECWS